MGRMDGNGVDVEIADPRGRIAQLELEVQRLERANAQLQAERDKLSDDRRFLHEANKKLDAKRDEWEKEAKAVWAKLQGVQDCSVENEFLRMEAEHDRSIVGRGYRSVTVYADGTVEVDRSFDDDDQPVPSRRAL